MLIPDELIQRFFNKKCTAEEAEQVALFLKDNPAAADKYLSETEWSTITTTDEDDIVTWDKTWEMIRKKNRKKAIVLWSKRSAVAACIATAAFMGFQLFSGRDNVVAEVTETAEVRQVQHKVVQNNTAKKFAMLLPDSSVVTLSPQAVITYDAPFQDNKRTVYLEGEANFKVTKNALKPFTVYAGTLATTALGTEFTITASKNSNNVIVRLFSGKVVVKQLKNISQRDSSVFLSPGEQLQYNNTKTLFVVSKITPKAAGNLKAGTKENELKDKEATDKLVFNGTLLSEVMQKLSAYYKTSIEYDASEIKTMSFTGTITKDDSLPMVLKVIGQMNDLEITQKEEGFVIHKQ